MTSSIASIVNVPLSARDIQWLSAMEAAVSTLLHPTATDDELEFNMNAIECLYALHYSYDEARALRDRLHALLPADTPMRFTDPRLLPASGATLPS